MFAYYLYAIMLQLPHATELDGKLDDISGMLICYQDLCAVVKPVSEAEFGPTALEVNLQDPTWVTTQVMAHQQRLASLIDRYTVLPFRFGTLLPDEKAIQHLLKAQYEEWQTALQRLVGTTEWGIKIQCEKQRLVASLAETAPELAEQRQAIAQVSPGMAYFKRKKLLQAAEQLIQTKMESYVRDSHAQLSNQAKQAVSNTAQTDTIFNGAYLVDDQNKSVFVQTVKALQTHYAKAGLSYELTGPWPPYNFVVPS